MRIIQKYKNNEKKFVINSKTKIDNIYNWTGSHDNNG